MLLTFFITTMLTFTTLLYLAPSPLPLGFMILLLALFSAPLISHITSSWFGLMMFLIYIGGLLVMFIYFAALSPNKLMSMNRSAAASFLVFFPSTFFLALCFISFSPHTVIYSPHQHLTTLYSTTNLPTLLMLGFILFLILIAVVKISTQSAGPLRPFK